MRISFVVVSIGLFVFIVIASFGVFDLISFSRFDLDGSRPFVVLHSWSLRCLSFGSHSS